jgi:hypothetical protein
MDNKKGYRWPISDETIALEIGSKWPRSVRRARFRLRAAGYLTWERTRTSNVYSFNFAKAKAGLAMLEQLKKNGFRGDQPRPSDGTRESPIPVSSPVKEESPKVEAHSRERVLPLMRVVGGTG